MTHTTWHFLKVLLALFIGTDHMKEIEAEKDEILANKPTGSDDVEEQVKIKQITSIPIGFPGEGTENVFQGLCLVMSIIFSIHINRGWWGNDWGYGKDGEIMNKIGAQSESNHIKAMQKGLMKYNKLLSKYPILGRHIENKSLNTICPVLSKEYNVNIVCHTTNNNDKIIKTYPEVYDETLPSAHIHVEEQLYGESHISLIKNLKAFYDEHGMNCMYCRGTFTGNSYLHKCTA